MIFIIDDILCLEKRTLSQIILNCVKVDEFA